MILRIALALLLIGSFAFAAAPERAPAASAAAPASADDCGTCPASGDGATDCADDCPLCVCGPHRAPMTAPPTAPDLDFFAVAEFAPAGDHMTLAPIVRDILHVPRLHPSSTQS